MNFIPPDNLKSSSYLQQISDWTDSQKMKINDKKSSVMILNETKKYQFSTRLHLNNNLLEIIQETQLLGIIISSDLTWHKNV